MSEDSLQRHVDVIILQSEPPGRILNMTKQFITSKLDRLADNETFGSRFKSVAKLKLESVILKVILN